MTRTRVAVAALACLMLTAALAASASAATKSPKFRPRIGGALGIVPPVRYDPTTKTDVPQFSPDIASGSPTPETYHGGTVMTGGITVHTIFWSGGIPNAFPASPGFGIAGYERTIQNFYTDVAAASTGTSGQSCTTVACAVFTVLPQYAQGTIGNPITSGKYTISYKRATDSINDSHPYPPVDVQCASPNNTPFACITDGQIQTEIDNIAPTNERGLHNLWFVFLPAGVDECILPGVCGTNAFGAYHSDFDINGHGVTIYAIGIDPTIETNPIAPGGDPNGNPDAELTSDIAAHETVEAMTDPQGVGWMDPNGFEVADKCEFGAQYGTPLGFHGPDRAEFNQVIDGRPWHVQDMWSNDANGGSGACVQATSDTSNPLPLPQVNLTQFSNVVSGNVGQNKAFGVTVALIREAFDPSALPGTNQVVVAHASTTSRAINGSWSVTLPGHVVGDDRDQINVIYSGAGAPTNQAVQTGNGGNPFTASGWTGWTALDFGMGITNEPGPNPLGVTGPSVTMAPCFQTGVLGAFINGTEITGPSGETSPTDFCSTSTDAATMQTDTIRPSDVVTTSSNDNRAYSPADAYDNTIGALVNLKVQGGEPDAVSQFLDAFGFSPALGTFIPSGFPTCSADVERQSVTCVGLVTGAKYTARDGILNGSGTADSGGKVTISLRVRRGDTVRLSNSARVLTTLRVANLRATVNGEQSVLSGGTCQPFDYYAAPLSSPPTSSSAGELTAFAGGAALTDGICPANGHLAGFPSDQIVQTDEFSGGSTITEVPNVLNTSPMDGEIVYGPFTALAQSGLAGPNNTTIPTDSTSKIGVVIRPAAGGAPVFAANNVDTLNGVNVPALKKGPYKATWTLTDINGDVRVVGTRFIEQGGPATPPKFKVVCTLKNGRITCKVVITSAKDVKGTMRIRIARGAKVAALGHGMMRHSKATISMRERRAISRGNWTVTIVVSPAGRPSMTGRTTLHVS
jgi:hypothetical protein